MSRFLPCAVVRVLTVWVATTCASAQQEPPAALFKSLVASHERAVALDAVYQLEIFRVGDDGNDAELLGRVDATLRLAKPASGSARVELRKGGELHVPLELFGDGGNWFTIDRQSKRYQLAEADLGSQLWTPQLDVFRAWSGEPRAKPISVMNSGTEDGPREITVLSHDSSETYLVGEEGQLLGATYTYRSVNTGGILHARQRYTFERWDLLETLEEPHSWPVLPPEGYEEFDANWNRTRRLVAPGQAFPDVRLAFIDGSSAMTSDLRGKTVVLSFWFVGCPPCRKELPELQQLAARYAERDDVLFVCANPIDRLPQVEAYWFAQEFSALRAAQVHSTTAQTCRVNTYPSLYVLGPDGSVFLRSVGYSPERSMAKLELAVERALRAAD